MIGFLIALVIIAITLIIFVPAAIRIVQEYERGVIFRLGRLVGARGPGLFFIIPFMERMRKVDLRTVTMDVPVQEAITGDNVTVKIDAVIYFRVVKPEDSVVKIQDHIRATSMVSQTTLRSIVGQSQLDDLLGRRKEINESLQVIIDEATEPWGVKVSMVEVRDVQIPTTMQRAIARQAEAERERRAKIIHAEGEHQAAERLTEAARVMSSQPAALQLRYLATLSEMATERTSTIVFPLPIDLMNAFLNRVPPQGGGGGDSSGSSTPPAGSDQ